MNILKVYPDRYKAELEFTKFVMFMKELGLTYRMYKTPLMVEVSGKGQVHFRTRDAQDIKGKHFTAVFIEETVNV